MDETVDATTRHKLYAPRSLNDPFPGYVDWLALDPEPRGFSIDVFDDILRHAIANGASEVNLQTEEPVFIQVQGMWCRITKRAVPQRDMEVITNHLYGPNGTAKLNAGDELNERYPIFERRSSEIGDVNVKHMLRYNVTPCEYREGDNGIQITLRVVRPIPPTLDELEIEPELQPHLFHQQGLVMIVGPTGSGKTTTQAAIVRSILEDADSHRKIALFDSPPEFAFYDVPRATALLSQHDVPKHIRSYALGIRNSLRRMTRVIVVGESRDRETMEAALEGAKTGQALYTTGHAGSCVEAISRFADMFTPEERLPKVFELIDSLRVMVVQKLLPRCDVEKRVAIREFLVFDRDVRDRLREGTTLVEVEKILRGLVETRGQSMLTAAQKVFAKGMITAETLGVFEREAKVSLPEGLGLSF